MVDYLIDATIDWTTSVFIFDWKFASFFLNKKINQQKVEKGETEGKSTIKQSTEGLASVPS